MLRSAAAIVVLAMAIGTFLTVAFSDDGSSQENVTAPPTATRQVVRSTPAATTVPAPTATPAPVHTPFAIGEVPDRLAGFAKPVAGACLPSRDELLPNAMRAYRAGTHEGVDFYDSDNCVPMGLNTEILAAKAGTVVRADLGYQDLTEAELLELEQRVANGEGDNPDIEDVYRGRQVWIDHGDGVISRYAHLNGIAEGIDVGAQVAQGQVIGYMGESGSPESVTAPGVQVHLHFELRVDDAYLGLGASTDEVRRLYAEVLGP